MTTRDAVARGNGLVAEVMHLLRSDSRPQKLTLEEANVSMNTAYAWERDERKQGPSLYSFLSLIRVLGYDLVLVRRP